MAHPIIEAVYWGLFATSAAQPVEVPREVVVEPASKLECPCVTVRAPRVVYDWAGNNRVVYRATQTLTRDSDPLVGMSEQQIDRMTRFVTG
ncbi:MAG: hypothetical protein H6953_14565 [Chromatiaceae bacterium]|nr:hypothetical protein [Gammaproteobacteria bacterium]MCP5301400.1 hypothetical protein [Chromatiaceae bacterium]MCP5306665.1 hypothetical protein [Chromatiaceae bacterium]MCP5421834.1 hypothetical protein [Chromatiaceae bacterium]